MSDHASLARYLDHAVLKPEMTQDEAAAAITLGVEHAVRTVCVRPADIALAQKLCDGSETEVSCVLAFPHGAALPQSKADEAKRYIDLGVAEIDMVVNYGLVRSGAWDGVHADIAAVADLTKPAGVLMKVIFETCTLDTEQIKRATEIAIAAQADFVKTSTGFSSSGASEEAVAAMVAAADGKIQVKASGGIRTREQAQRFIDMGCTRLGVGYSTSPVLCGANTQPASADTGSY